MCVMCCDVILACQIEWPACCCDTIVDKLSTVSELCLEVLILHASARKRLKMIYASMAIIYVPVITGVSNEIVHAYVLDPRVSVVSQYR